MRNFIHTQSKRSVLFLFFGAIFVLLLTLLTSVHFSTPLPGIPSTAVKTLDTGWTYENGDGLSAIEKLPCSIDYSENTLYLHHDLTNLTQDTEDALTFSTRYESIRVWADETLIYEAAQSREHALGSMWHFVPLNRCVGASDLRVELTKYNQDTTWTLSAVLLDHPDSVLVHLLYSYAPAIIFWAFSMLFSLLLLFVAIFMLREKIPGPSAMFVLSAFSFLSGQWILLDSKITTLFGGNYALTYFLSYCAFYLLMVPFLLFIQLTLNHKNRLLHYLPWIFTGNAALCMGLHLLGMVYIRNTTFIVHILIFITIVASTWEFVRSILRQEEKRSICTFFGMLIIYGAAVISIFLYHTKKLPPTNSTILYSWAFLILLLGMTLDAISSLSRLWKQKQYIDRYRQLATQDSMTLMGNRNAFELHLQGLVANPPRKLTFILFDVDGLKTINDTQGHHVGDQIICLSAQCIQDIFGSRGHCYRIGGDEFCVILTASINMKKKLRQFETLFQIRSKAVFSTAVSYGWAERTFAEGEKVTAKEITALQKEADTNLYRQKRERKQNRNPSSAPLHDNMVSQKL